MTTFPAFPGLRHFYTGISDQGLEYLVQSAPYLELLSLKLENPPLSHYILAAASNFTRLITLVIQFGSQSSLSGQDLLLLAQKCPHLAELEIGYVRSQPSVFGMTDSIIDEVSQRIPKLSHLRLILDHPEPLTWNSLLSLARHCKNLETLRLSCGFTWQEAVDGTQENIFSRLQSSMLFLTKITGMRRLRMTRRLPFSPLVC